MKLNAGIITDKLAECLQFYTEVLGFGIRFQNEWYLLLHTPDGSTELSFLAPALEHQHPLFQKAFSGAGVYLTIEVEDVDALYADMKSKGVPITMEIKDEDWGDRHFILTDPNGIGVDLVQHSPPE